MRDNQRKRSGRSVTGNFQVIDLSPEKPANTDQVSPINGPVSLQLEPTINGQERKDEQTIIWGANDSFPLEVANAVNDSPAASSCIGTIAQFIKGSGFSDPDLMKFKIDKYGTTLWDFHCSLADYFALLEGWTVNFKWNENLKITGAYVLPLESMRFVRPSEDTSADFSHIKYNPYFGTAFYQSKYTKKYSLYNNDPKALRSQFKDPEFSGQVYYYGKTRPPYKFYPIPRYWSGKKWIYVDGQIQTFHASNLDNGFFQSVLMNVIGDPNAWTTDPRFQSEYTDSQGVKRMRGTKTNQQVFSENMQAQFSGSKKAGNVMVTWSQNADAGTKIQAFPNSSNFDVLSGTLSDAIRGITMATRVPAVLANLPQQQSSLGSDGNSMQKAVELMQSNTAEQRKILENFYNDILLPQFEGAKKGMKVEIKNYTPITTPVSIDDKFWDVLTTEEKRSFIKSNVPGVELIEPVESIVDTVIDQQIGEVKPVEPVPAPNESLKNLNLNDIKRVSKIAAQYTLQQLTYDQAKQFLLSYGLTETDIDAWLTKPEEL